MNRLKGAYGIAMCVLVHKIREWLGINVEVAFLLESVRGLQTDFEVFMAAYVALREVNETEFSLVNSKIEPIAETLSLLSRRVQFYGAHNDSLKHTANKFKKLLEEEERRKSKP